MYRYRVVGDLHMSDKSAGDMFYSVKGNEWAFMSFVMDTKDKDMSLIVNGDGLDLWESSIYTICRAYYDLFWRMGQTSWVQGNHDSKIAYLNGFCGIRVTDIHHIFTNNAVNVLVTHGHFCDPYNKPDAKLGYLASKVNGVLERYTDVRLEPTYNRLKHRVPTACKTTDYFTEVCSVAWDEHCSKAIFSHTHPKEPVERQMSNITVYNLPSWNDGFWYAEIIRGAVAIRQWRA